MRKRKLDPDVPHGRLTEVRDFLPPPHLLAIPRDDVKVTLALSRRSVTFLKMQARRHHTKYQRMIRELVDRYVSRFDRPS